MVATAVLIIYSLLPLGTAFELGGDEGFALTRTFVHNQGLLTSAAALFQKRSNNCCFRCPKLIASFVLVAYA